ncbi:MAG: hypothetical protein Q8O48_11305 [Anaerolineales bacterium]|nr:hypothetical protein [Anaerolineales bacterium]
MPEGFTLTPILISLGALILGWAIGFFDSNNRSGKKIKEAEARAGQTQKEAERKIAQAEQQLALNAPAPQNDPDLLRIKNENGRAILEMDGLPVSGVLSPDKRKRLIDLLTILRPYLEGGQPQQPAPKSAQTAPVSAPVQRPVSRPSPPAPVQPVKPTLGAILSPAKKTIEDKPLTSLSIVGQIDFILQSRLMNTPLAGGGIRLQESLQGAVEVYVGLQKFPSVDDVPDETIKAAIRAAIAEWEEKYTPGL